MDAYAGAEQRQVLHHQHIHLVDTQPLVPLTIRYSRIDTITYASLTRTSNAFAARLLKSRASLLRGASQLHRQPETLL